MYKLLRKNKSLLVYFPLIVYWIILFIATTIPGNNVPNIGVSDKFEHLAGYMILSILLCLNYSFQNKIKLFWEKPFLMTFLTVAIYATLDELHQSFIPRRSCDVNDIMADIAGAAIGLVIVYIIKFTSGEETNTAS